MNLLKVCSILVSCLIIAPAHARNSKAPTHRTNTQILNFILDFQEHRLLDVAEAMPEDKYSFAPTGPGFTGVRTFAEQLKHIAADNYLLGAGILGEEPPVDMGTKESGAVAIHTKPEIIAYLKESFAYMHRASAAIDDGKEVIPTPGISPWPAGTATRLGVTIEDCVHSWDHYGQLVEYLRMNGIVPPASRK
jgi:hypothetical protein